MAATISWQRATGEGTEGFLQVSLECVAQGKSKGSSITSLSAPSSDPFQFRMVKATIDGTEFTEVNSGQIQIDNGVNPSDSRYANSTLDREIGEPIPTLRVYTGNINANIKDDTLDDLWDAADTISGTTKIEFIRGANDSLELTFTDTYPQGSGYAPTNLEGVNNLQFPFAVKSVAAVATDSISSY